MSTDRLGAALRDLVDDLDDGVVTPVADDLWAGGRRRRRTARLVPLVAAACVAALLTVALWPAGAPQASVPAVRLDSDGDARLTSYPDVIAKPPTIRTTATPGVTAALVPGNDSDPLYAVSPTGAVSQVLLPRDDWGFGAGPALSPDGRWVARGPALTNLVTGAVVPSGSERAQLVRAWGPPEEPAWWSPDSRRIFAGTFNQGQPRFGGIVIGTDGSTTEVPTVADGIVPVYAGWLDDNTLLALLYLGPGSTRLELRTWTVGDAAWTDDGTVISWSPQDSPATRASLSPDASRLLIESSQDARGTQSTEGTNAMMFDPRTGAQLGMPLTDGTLDPSNWASGSSVGWDGWGCRPVWNQGLPVHTDGTVSGFVEVPTGSVDGTRNFELVSVSSAYGDPCVAFAGNELRGTPVTNHLALWQERLWAWGMPLLGIGLVGLALWGWNRRHRNQWRRPLGHLPPIIAKPF